MRHTFFAVLASLAIANAAVAEEVVASKQVETAVEATQAEVNSKAAQDDQPKYRTRPLEIKSHWLIAGGVGLMAFAIIVTWLVMLRQSTKARLDASK